MMGTRMHAERGDGLMKKSSSSHAVKKHTSVFERTKQRKSEMRDKGEKAGRADGENKSKLQGPH